MNHCSDATLDGDYLISDRNDLERVAGYAAISGSLLIEESALVEISVPLCLREIEGSLTIRRNASLKNIDGLRHLHRIDGHVFIENNKNLSSIRGLESLKTVALQFYIVENETLQSLEGLSSLHSVGRSFSIQKNDALESIDSLPLLTHVDEIFKIARNEKLTRIVGFDSLESVGGLAISDNPSLEHFQKLERLDNVESQFVVVRNKLLTDLDWVSSLESFSEDTIVACNRTPNRPFEADYCSSVDPTFIDYVVAPWELEWFGRFTFGGEFDLSRGPGIQLRFGTGPSFIKVNDALHEVVLYAEAGYCLTLEKVTNEETDADHLGYLGFRYGYQFNGFFGLELFTDSLLGEKNENFAVGLDVGIRFRVVVVGLTFAYQWLTDLEGEHFHALILSASFNTSNFFHL